MVKCERMFWIKATLPIGDVYIAQAGDKVCYIGFSSNPTFIKQGTRKDDDLLLGRVRKELKEYCEGTRIEFSFPWILPVATSFQQSVWNAISQVPYGHTTSYTSLAQTVGKPKAHRAVGTACGANQLAIVIPCHRIMPLSGALGGYAGGIEVKQKLLQIEQGYSVF